MGLEQEAPLFKAGEKGQQEEGSYDLLEQGCVSHLCNTDHAFHSCLRVVWMDLCGRVGKGFTSIGFFLGM